MITGGVEVLVGVVQEPVFGPLVVFGLGGVATEVLGDHAARLTPLTGADADAMIRAVRAAPLLLGHRGAPAADLAALADVLLRVSRLADDLPEVAELDLNPVMAQPGGVCAVDARIRVAPARRGTRSCVGSAETLIQEAHHVRTKLPAPAQDRGRGRRVSQIDGRPALGHPPGRGHRRHRRRGARLAEPCCDCRIRLGAGPDERRSRVPGAGGEDAWPRRSARSPGRTRPS